MIFAQDFWDSLEIFMGSKAMWRLEGGAIECSHVNCSRFSCHYKLNRWNIILKAVILANATWQIKLKSRLSIVATNAIWFHILIGRSALQFWPIINRFRADLEEEGYCIILG